MASHQAGDTGAFERLYGLFSPELRRYLGGDDDLMQEVFLKIHQARRSFDSSRPFRPWAFAIARHVVLMQRRSEGRRVRREAVVVHESSPDVENQQIVRRFISQALARLTEEGRQIIRLRYFVGLEFEEMARALGVRSGALRVRASRALQCMRDI